MRVGELAFTSYIFSKMDDGSYEEFLRNTGDHFNIEKPGHSQYLLNWLRKWRMRNARNADEAATEKLIQWHKQYGDRLPDENTNIWELNDNHLKGVRLAYEELLKPISNAPNKRSFGMTGATKILFALRPKSLPLWDGAIREKLQEEEKPISGNAGQLYINFIKYLRDHIIPDLLEQCQAANVQLSDLPNIFGLNNSNRITTLKLIDEYYWVTITKGIEPPNRDTLQKWLNWI
ncbi:MAG: hypothetical protein WC496_02005 [Phycisphaerae bacterium]|jgi:hypothetical protein